MSRASFLRQLRGQTDQWEVRRILKAYVDAGQVVDDVDADTVVEGNPKQERFIETHRSRLRTPVMMGVGVAGLARLLDGVLGRTLSAHERWRATEASRLERAMAELGRVARALAALAGA
jgi:UDP-N-acetyl-D-mannosaminuronic acid transferase (WecB/TagA/CpsF family)